MIRLLKKTILHVIERFRVEKSDKNQIEFIKLLLDLLPDPVFIKNSLGIYTDCNKKFLEFVQLSREEIIGKSVYDIASKELADKYFEKDKELFDNPGHQEYEYRIVSNENHRERVVLFKKCTFHNPDGTIGGIIGVIHDITHQKEKEARLIQLSEIDPLTQIYNRRYFDAIYDAEIKRSTRSNTRLSLILIDIDYFKNYNDTYGHLAGDDSLIKVAQTINQTLRRPGDSVARYGGEEFICILPDTDTQGAIHVANQIKTNIANLKIKHEQSGVSHWITVSQGIYTVLGDHLSIDQQAALEKVDKALYRAKSNGRNRFEIFCD